MGLDWPIISLKLSIVIYQFIAFFKTVFGWEHLGKVPKQLFGNIYFWGITIREVQRLINVIIIHSKKISCFWLVKTIFTITSCCWPNLERTLTSYWTNDLKNAANCRLLKCWTTVLLLESRKNRDKNGETPLRMGKYFVWITKQLLNSAFIGYAEFWILCLSG